MSKSNKWIVITSINEPSEAVKKYAAMDGWNLVVVGDVSTPKSWLTTDLKLTYISIDEQRKSHYEIAKLIPERHYTRKMFGYLHAIKNGAEFIVDTDDDNIPTNNWESQWIIQEADEIELLSGSWINIYKVYGQSDIWPRGFPLNFIKNNPPISRRHEFLGKRSLGIVQGLADNDPDVDAIYRLTNNRQVNFRKMENRLVLDSNSFTPINSQNTLFTSTFFPLLFLPTTSTFRTTDIIRGIVAQPILWKADSYLGISNAEVIQERNEHDYMLDFDSEIPIYSHSDRFAQIALSTVSETRSISENLIKCYESMIYHRLVRESELKIINAWISDINEIRDN